MSLGPRLWRAATTTAFRILGEARFEDLRARFVARKIRTGRYRSGEVDLLPQLVAPGSLAIDVGANLGLYAYHLALLTEHPGRVLAFEPVPGTCQALRRVLATLGVADRVQVVEKAAGAARGSVQFALPRRADGRADTARAAAVAPANAASAHEFLTVPMVLLDDEVPTDAEVSFLKIDTEGGDLFALQGAASIIDRCHPTLLLEVAPTLLARHGLTGVDIGAFLGEHGYETYAYEAVRRRLVPVPAAEMNGDLLAVHPSRVDPVEPLIER
jgi:FkbM family methyltransferase